MIWDYNYNFVLFKMQWYPLLLTIQKPAFLSSFMSSLPLTDIHFLYLNIKLSLHIYSVKPQNQRSCKFVSCYLYTENLHFGSLISMFTLRLVEKCVIIDLWKLTGKKKLYSKPHRSSGMKDMTDSRFHHSPQRWTCRRQAFTIILAARKIWWIQSTATLRKTVSILDSLSISPSHPGKYSQLPSPTGKASSRTGREAVSSPS